MTALVMLRNISASIGDSLERCSAPTGLEVRGMSHYNSDELEESLYFDASPVFHQVLKFTGDLLFMIYSLIYQ